MFQGLIVNIIGILSSYIDQFFQYSGFLIVRSNFQQLYEMIPCSRIVPLLPILHSLIYRGIITSGHLISREQLVGFFVSIVCFQGKSQFIDRRRKTRRLLHGILVKRQVVLPDDVSIGSHPS